MTIDVSPDGNNGLVAYHDLSGGIVKLFPTSMASGITGWPPPGTTAT